jgi:hypothetical protein
MLRFIPNIGTEKARGLCPLFLDPYSAIFRVNTNIYPKSNGKMGI